MQKEWFPNHLLDASTRQTYSYLLGRYILPSWLGDMRMVEILPSHVREWVVELVARADGHVLTFDCRPRSDADETALVAEFNAARAAEWTEFASERDKFDAEIAKARRINKLTVAELDEEEQNLDRLRRWWRELRARDIFVVPNGVDAEERLKRCEAVILGYADEVYRAVHAPLGRDDREA